MSDKSKNNPKPKNPSTPAVVRKQYLDQTGISRVVLLPEGEKDVKTGIPVSLDLSPLFGHMPDEFQRSLYEALHAKGLVDAADYFKPGAAERFRSALLSVVKHDFFSVQTLAKEEL